MEQSPSPVAAELIKKFPAFMELEDFLPRSQEPAAGG
jgi:hypothetical protein